MWEDPHGTVTGPHTRRQNELASGQGQAAAGRICARSGGYADFAHVLHLAMRRRRSRVLAAALCLAGVCAAFVAPAQSDRVKSRYLHSIERYSEVLARELQRIRPIDTKASLEAFERHQDVYPAYLLVALEPLLSFGRHRQGRERQEQGEKEGE